MKQPNKNLETLNENQMYHDCSTVDAINLSRVLSHVTKGNSNDAYHKPKGDKRPLCACVETQRMNNIKYDFIQQNAITQAGWVRYYQFAYLN